MKADAAFDIDAEIRLAQSKVAYFQQELASASQLLKAWSRQLKALEKAKAAQPK